MSFSPQNNAIAVATNQSLGQLHRDIETCQRSVAILHGQINQLIALQEQTLAAIQQQTQLMEAVQARRP